MLTTSEWTSRYLAKIGIIPEEITTYHNDSVYMHWKNLVAQAIVTFDVRDQKVAYTLFRGGRFVPGKTEISDPFEVPGDLREYLTKYFRMKHAES